MFSVRLTSLLCVGLVGLAPTFVPEYATQSKKVVFPSGESLPVTTGPEKKGQEYYNSFAGEASSKNPLLDVSGVHRKKKLSKNFTAGEFARSGNKEFSKARIDPELVKCLQKIRNHVKKPVIINSGYRSYLYNKKIYEDKNQKPTQSRHISGQAADIRIKGMTGLEIAKAALKAYGTNIGVGIGGNYAHIDVRGKYASWTYFKGDKNKAHIRAIDLYRKELLKK